MEKKPIVYAIYMDLDLEKLEKECEESLDNAFIKIELVLGKYNFKGFGSTHQQTLLYFGEPDKVTVVDCILAIQDLAERFEWFTPCVRNARVCRVEDDSDLIPAIHRE